MSLGKLIALAALCALTAGAQQPPSQTARSQGPASQSPPEAAAAATQPSGTPETRPAAHLAPGTAIFLHIITPAANYELSKVQFRNSFGDSYEKVAKEFQKEGVFRLVGDLNDAQVVFFVFHSWKTKSNLSENYLALAVSPEEYKKHVQMLNPYRGIADLSGMFHSALWSSGKGYNMGKQMATLGYFGGGRPNPAELVKEFHHDVQ